MLENYLIIHKSILPEYYEKVLQVRRMMESGKKKDVSQCVREVGISRSTYYKYKDYILEPMALSGGRKPMLRAGNGAAGSSVTGNERAFVYECQSGWYREAHLFVLELNRCFLFFFDPHHKLEVVSHEHQDCKRTARTVPEVLPEQGTRRDPQRIRHSRE